MDKQLTAYESACIFVELSPGPDKLLDEAVARLHEIDKLIAKGNNMKPWVCELCYNTHSGDEDLPKTWHLILQSVICPECVILAKKEKKYIPDMKGRCYAPTGREDPRLYTSFTEKESPTIERIKHAASKVGDTVGRGRDHAQIYLSKEKGFFRGSKQGFETTAGRFVTRREAAEIAFKAGQIPKWEEGQILISEELWSTGPYEWNMEQGYHKPPVERCGGSGKEPKGEAGDYTKDEIDEFLRAANSDLGTKKYIGQQMIPDYAKAVIIGQQQQSHVNRLEDENRQWQETVKAVQEHHDNLKRKVEEYESLILSGEKVIREYKEKLHDQVNTATLKELDVFLTHTNELSKLKRKY